MPVVIYHGIDDDVVDPQLVRNIAVKCFGKLEHHFVDDDHPLHKTFPVLDWKKLLAEGLTRFLKIPFMSAVAVICRKLP